MKRWPRRLPGVSHALLTHHRRTMSTFMVMDWLCSAVLPFSFTLGLRPTRTHAHFLHSQMNHPSPPVRDTERQLQPIHEAHPLASIGTLSKRIQSLVFAHYCYCTHITSIFRTFISRPDYRRDDFFPDMKVNGHTMSGVAQKYVILVYLRTCHVNLFFFGLAFITHPVIFFTLSPFPQCDVACQGMKDRFRYPSPPYLLLSCYYLQCFNVMLLLG